MSIIDLTSNIAYASLSAAIAGSSGGDVIALSAGMYVEDFPLITHSLTIEGVGGLAHLVTPDPTPANLRAILYVAGGAGADLSVRNLELSGAVGPYSNGAGILFEVGNGNLTIQNSFIHGNQDGILVGSQTGTITVDGSEFAGNGLAPTDPRYGYSHNIYVNEAAKFILSNSYVHDALGGHEVKSRAGITVVTGNRIQDQAANSSYDIDLAEGGQATITGNVIEKGINASNRYAVHFGGEAYSGNGYSWPDSSLLLQDNILINDRSSASVLLNQTSDGMGGQYPATVTGNTIYGFDPVAAAANTLLPAPGPALDTTSLFATPEPAGLSVLGAALLATALVRRLRARRSGRHA